MNWKLVIDTRNAPALADFWAAALHYEVEDPSALVEQLLAAGQLPADARPSVVRPEPFRRQGNRRRSPAPALPSPHSGLRGPRR
ncbi:VOC family protein [Nocardia sp. NPDC052278]|uniref:VOC family protein n=1 Tax=unclassified Nocardia TaxID=2637762 RepID=UPI0036C8BE9B